VCFVLLVLPAAVVAHDSFDDDDAAGTQFDADGYGVSPVADDSSEQVDVPSVYEPVREVSFTQTAAEATPPSGLFGQPYVVPADGGLPPGASALPFVLLPIGLDGDQDGLSNNDERVLGTDPVRTDTDGDGYIDGLEVVRGYNPLIPSPDDRVTYAVQQINAQATYTVTGVRLEVRAGQEVLTVTGTAPNFSLVLLAAASDDERVWVTRADSSGRFLYISADTLAQGDHTVRAAPPAADGQLAAGEAYAFRRTPDGVELTATPSPSPDALIAGLPVGRGAVIGTAAAGGIVIFGVMVFFVRRAQQLRRARTAQAELHRQLQQSPPDS